MKSISQKELKDLQTDLAKRVLVADVRTPGEFALSHMQWAINLPLDTFNDHIEKLKEYDTVVCYCNSGNSSSQFIKRAEWKWINNCVNFSGGLSSCKWCDLVTKKWPLPLMQQVQVVAGWLVLLWIILRLVMSTYERNNYFIILSAFVGWGLVFAWISGRCGMAKILARMPRNKIDSDQKPTEIFADNLIIKQFEDKNLAHYSYIAISNGEALVVDPERDPKKYYEYAKHHNAKIVAVLNTHPHADFASGHLQIHNDTWATIYVGSKVWAEYKHIALDWREWISLWKAKIDAYFTPWHSPDSISYLLKDGSNKQIAMFTWDRVFIGDVGRADLRETVGNIKAKQEELAWMMYDTTRSILASLDKSLMILPAHGAGTSCGKWLSKMNMDTLANQMKYNPMLQEMPREDFIKELTSEQPAIPVYFTNSVLLNKKWNSSYAEAFSKIQELFEIPQWVIAVDTRSREQSMNHPIIHWAVNIARHNVAFTGTLWAIIKPSEEFVLICERASDKDLLLHAILSIWYEKHCLGIYVIETNGCHKIVSHKHDIENSDYVILDVRSVYAFENNPQFTNTINIPLEQLRDRMDELDKSKSYVPYCGGLYKSSIALSILQSQGYKVRKLYV